MRDYRGKLKSLPRKIFYKGHWYEVKKQSNIFDEDGSELCGDVDHEAKIVRISKNQSLSAQWETLLHEFIHEAWPDAIKLSTKQEEDIVCALSEEFFSFLVTNNLLSIFKEDKSSKIRKAISLLKRNGFEVISTEDK